MLYELNFSKFEEDLKKTYEIVSKSRLPRTSEEISTLFKDDNKKQEFINIANRLNRILFVMINSYYFEGQYKNFHLICETLNNGEHLKISKTNTEKTGEHSIIEEFKISGGVFYKEIDQKTWSESSKNTKYFYKDYELDIMDEQIINTLKKSDTFYKILFESKPLNQQLNIEDRHNYEISYVETLNEPMDYLNISNYHKIEKIANENSNIQEFNEKIETNLKHCYQLEYFNLENPTKGWFIAHNKYEIAAVSTLGFPSREFEGSEKFKYVNYISVAEPFRGNGLGIKLFEAIIQKANEEKWIIERSHPSSIGKIYLEKNIDSIVKNNQEIPIIVYSHHNDLIMNSLLLIFKNSENKIFEFSGKEYKLKTFSYEESRNHLNNILDKVNELVFQEKIELINSKDKEFEINQKYRIHIKESINHYIFENYAIKEQLKNNRRLKL